MYSACFYDANKSFINQWLISTSPKTFEIPSGAYFIRLCMWASDRYDNQFQVGTELTKYETASVIFSTGSNQLGDELTDIQTLSGSVKIQGQLLINGIPLSSGNTLAVRYNVDYLDGVNILGLPVDNTGKRYIPLQPNDVLRATTLANIASGSAWLTAHGADYQQILA